MPTVYWTGNSQTIAQVATLTVTAVALNGTLTATINGKNIAYTCIAGETTTTAAAAWQALLAASTAPPEFQEITFTQSGAVVTCTAATAGRPFSMTSAGAGGATVTQATPTAGAGPNDVSLANNWLSDTAVVGVPVDGDTVIIADSSISLLYNLELLAAVRFASLTRYNSFTGQIGLPQNNPSGYYEYRATYFTFKGPAVGALPVTIGLGPGSGPTFERYFAGSQRTDWNVLASPACRLRNTSALSTFIINGAAVDIATLPAEVSTCSGGITVVNGGTLNLGSGVTLSGTLTVESASVAFCETVPTTIVADAGQVTMNASGTVTTLTGKTGSTFTWNAVCSVTTLTLTTNSIFDKSGDSHNIVVANSAIDSTCQIIDPWSTITFTNPTTVSGTVTSGPFTFGPNRSVKIS